MAEGTREQGLKKTYYSIIEGKLTRRANENEAGAVSRVSKTGKTVWEKKLDFISGTIRKMQVVEKEFDTDKGKKKMKSLEVELSDVGDILILSIPVDSKFFETFCSKIENVSLSVDVTITPYSFVDKDGRQVSGINMFQDDVKVDYRYTKDNPGNRPSLDGRVDEDEFKIFRIKLSKFYQGVIEKVNAKLSGNTPAAAESKPQTAKEKAMAKIRENSEEISEDDLPW